LYLVVSVSFVCFVDNGYFYLKKQFRAKRAKRAKNAKLHQPVIRCWPFARLVNISFTITI